MLDTKIEVGLFVLGMTDVSEKKELEYITELKGQDWGWESVMACILLVSSAWCNNTSCNTCCPSLCLLLSFCYSITFLLVLISLSVQ